MRTLNPLFLRDMTVHIQAPEAYASTRIYIYRCEKGVALPLLFRKEPSSDIWFHKKKFRTAELLLVLTCFSSSTN